MSLFIASFQFGQNTHMQSSFGVRSIWYDIIQGKILYKSERGSIVFTSNDVVIFYSQNMNTNPPTKEYKKCFVEVIHYNELLTEHSPYQLFPTEVFPSRNCMMNKRVFVYSNAYQSKEQAIGDICTQTSCHIYHEDFKHHFVFTCDEFDKHVLEFARKNTEKYHSRLLSTITTDFAEHVRVCNRNFTYMRERLNDLDKLLIELCHNQPIPSRLIDELKHEFNELADGHYIGIDDFTDDDEYEDYENKDWVKLWQSKKHVIKDTTQKIVNMFNIETVSNVKEYSVLTDAINNLDIEEDCDLDNEIQKLNDLLSIIDTLNNKQKVLTIVKKHTVDITLTPSNLIKQTIDYHKQNKLSNTDIVDTIKLMLSRGQYTLGMEIATNKIDFAEANTLFLAGVAPTKLEKNDLQNLIFKNVVCDNLI